MLYHFFKTIFTIPNNFMHQRSILNISFFIFQSSFYLWNQGSLNKHLLIYLAGDIKINPGPVTYYSQGFKICHWNCNSLPTDTFIKIPHLEAYAISHHIDIICLSKTFLNTSYSNNDTRPHLHGYSIYTC